MLSLFLARCDLSCIVMGAFEMALSVLGEVPKFPCKRPKEQTNVTESHLGSWKTARGGPGAKEGPPLETGLCANGVYERARGQGSGNVRVCGVSGSWPVFQEETASPARTRRVRL